MSRPSRILTLGIEDEVLRLWEEEQDYSQVAIRLNEAGYEVTVAQVSRFLKNADSDDPPVALAGTGVDEDLRPLSEIVRFDGKASIFEPLASLQEQYTYLVELLNQTITKPSLAIRVLRELRETLKLTVAIQDRVVSYQTVYAFNQAVLGVLDEVDPAIREKVLERLERRSALRAVLARGAISESQL